MCYNCGCQKPNDTMGKGMVSAGGGSLTESDFKIMAEKWGMDLVDTKKNVYTLLKKEFENKPTV